MSWYDLSWMHVAQWLAAQPGREMCGWRNPRRKWSRHPDSAVQLHAVPGSRRIPRRAELGAARILAMLPIGLRRPACAGPAARAVDAPPFPVTGIGRSPPGRPWAAPRVRGRSNSTHAMARVLQSPVELDMHARASRRRRYKRVAVRLVVETRTCKW